VNEIDEEAVLKPTKVSKSKSGAASLFDLLGEDGGVEDDEEEGGLMVSHIPSSLLCPLLSN
jgi:hypothetical protein